MYLYDNAQPDAENRLLGLEAIEDRHTISLLENLSNLEGSACLEIGAGAGSIATWLAHHAGPSGSVTATDIEPRYLSGSGFEVLRHDIENDELPSDHYDLVHIRHVLIHLPNPARALENVVSSMKQGGLLLAEESDLSSWQPGGSLPDKLQESFENGVAAVFKTYEENGMNTRLGSQLATLLSAAGLKATSQKEFKRNVFGGSPEAVYQSQSANQLACTIAGDSTRSELIMNLADCLLNPKLIFQSRTTVSVLAVRES